MSKREDELAEIDKQIEELQAQREKILSRPAEPENQPSILYFKLAFRIDESRRGRIPQHELVAIRSRMMWYVTGVSDPVQPLPKGVTWDKLLDWISAQGGTELEVVNELVSYGLVRPKPTEEPAPEPVNGRRARG